MKAAITGLTALLVLMGFLGETPAIATETPALSGATPALSTPAEAVEAPAAPAETCEGVIPWHIVETNMNTGITTVRTLVCVIGPDGHVRLVSP